MQVDRRISELFSLQELSYVLSVSIQLDRIVEQVARYAARFLQAEGAIVALAEPDGHSLKVVAATGTLEPLLHGVSEGPDTALVRVALGRDRLEVVEGGESSEVNLIGDLMVLRVGGAFVAWKGRVDAAEADAGRNAAEVVGLQERDIVVVRPFPAAESHRLYLYLKVVETPDRFPRRAGMARKRPLAP